MILKAHRTVKEEVDGLEIVPARPQRAWMNDISGPSKNKGFANRCLPLLMANQLGWEIRVKRDYVIVALDDGDHVALYAEQPPTYGAPQNNFLNNIVTWPMPWVFETPPGWDLLVLPPANTPLPAGVTCLSGLVETDHAVQSFTINWLLSARTAVFLSAGDALACLLPFPTGQIEGWGLEEAHKIPEGYPEYVQKRSETVDPAHPNFGRWDKDYWDGAKRRKVKKK